MSSMRMGGHHRRYRAAEAMGLAAGIVLALPATGLATESGSPIGFDLQLRPPDEMLLARHTRPKAPPDTPAAPEKDVPPAAPPSAATNGGSPDLGFDLLGPDGSAAKPTPVEDAQVKRRRTMLTLHPLLGIGLVAAETATAVVGQLNYNDKFGGGPGSDRYRMPHRILAFTTGGLFVATGLVALLAPNPLGKEHQGVDRVLLHKIGMVAASVGMAAQIILGIYTAQREGYQNQKSLAVTHLAIGYATLAATYVAVGTIVF